MRFFSRLMIPVGAFLLPCELSSCSAESSRFFESQVESVVARVLDRFSHVEIDALNCFPYLFLLVGTSLLPFVGRKPCGCDDVYAVSTPAQFRAFDDFPIFQDFGAAA